MAYKIPRKEDAGLIYNINKKNYLLVEVPVTRDNADEIESKMKKIGAIQQGIKSIKAGLFSGWAIVKYLVPTSKLEEYKKMI
jgi:hypothetical protein